MSETGGTEHRRVQRRVAREYRKLGFEVRESPTGEDLPPFLAGFAPDLIAVSDKDCVVVEIKRADTLKGSNKLTELAARVAEQPNWRFELFTLAAPQALESAAPSRAALDRQFAAILQAYETEDEARCWVSIAALTSTLERLLNLVALERGIEPTGRTIESLSRELSFQGVIDEATLASLEQARVWRDEAWHGNSGVKRPGLKEIEQIVEVCRVLQSALIEFLDEGSVARTEVDYSASAVAEIPEARPAVYTVQAANGRVVYVGVAAAGHVRERIRQHISQRPRRIPGDKIMVLQFDTEEQARRAEQIAIQEFSPKLNLTEQRPEPASRRA